LEGRDYAANNKSYSQTKNKKGDREVRIIHINRNSGGEIDTQQRKKQWNKLSKARKEKRDECCHNMLRTIIETSPPSYKSMIGAVAELELRGDPS
jgi:hypothetical protein